MAFNNTSAVDICSCVYLITYQALHSPTFRPHAHDNFQYAEDGHLQGKMHPNPNYIFYKLWFQGVSRAREKLCILVIGNEELFKKLLSVKNKFK